MTQGILYGIGVGPGDPDFITLKAVSILSQVDVVFGASSAKNSHSQAAEIVKPHLKASVPIQILPFPMTRNKQVMEAAWQDNAGTVIKVLEQGKNAAFITLGDSMTYSTYGYLLKSVRKLAPHIEICSIPGITSYQAAAARINTPLVEGEESMTLLSGVLGGDKFREISDSADNVVFLKAYKNTGDIVNALDEAGMADKSVGIVRCGLEGEQIITNVNAFQERKPDYWTLIISKKSGHCVESQKKTE
ncbi:precorrin-2 C(20)-methyltransferase [Desulfobacter postgatei]|uniref:Precorrin-2 C20-methyltransferase n=1 Tax=Desulfobacter postgatei 2ac9 TaxID=879212 RepID=I5B065_9BACT|nr:precorrin-2 C(20)-methyltransferase [Desulfobacter postgatei]EIM62878.1 precorrin-2 C20-methyltransferase [Desulfobacter postgatei 2ac9]